MSNETDLDWLARNVHKWHSSATHIARDKIFGHIFGWSTCIGIDFTHSGYTKKQWSDRRAELQRKPSWDKAASEYTHLVQTADGSWVFAFEPEIRGDQILSNSFDFLGSKGFKGELLGDWRDTLERRPADPSEPAVTERLTEAAQTVLAAAPALMDDKYSFDRDDWYELGELPPVGVECEIFGKDARPEKCKIIAYHKDQVAVQWESFGGGILDVLYLRGDYWKFRPIRTERDELFDIIRSASGSFTDLADAILAAGFKREAK